MAASKSPYIRLLHIQQEIDWMLETFADSTFEVFAANMLNVRAVERGFLIISEAAKSLPDEMLSAYPNIEWHAIRGFGNVLRHDYQVIEPRRLWVTIKTHLPELRTVVSDLLERNMPTQ